MGSRHHAMAMPRAPEFHHYFWAGVISAVLLWFFSKMDKKYSLGKSATGERSKVTVTTDTPRDPDLEEKARSDLRARAGR
jgi:hypothetical protein